MADTLAVVRMLHALFAALWLGMLTYHAFILVPAARQAAEAGGRVMRAMLDQGRLAVLFGVTSTLTILFGLWLYAGMEFWVIPQDAGRSIAVNLGVVLGLVAWGIGIFLNLPLTMKMKKATPDQAPALAKKLARNVHMIFGLVLLVFILMQLAPAL